MIYIDTSALVPLFIREAKSQAVIGWLEGSGERVAISEWCLVEFGSAAAMKIRAGHASVDLMKQATARVHEFAQKYCTVAVPGRDEFRRAAELAANDALKLRAGDALHLAIAQGLNAQGILCLDAAMSATARALGMNVVVI